MTMIIIMTREREGGREGAQKEWREGGQGGDKFSSSDKSE